MTLRYHSVLPMFVLKTIVSFILFILFLGQTRQISLLENWAKHQPAHDRMNTRRKSYNKPKFGPLGFQTTLRSILMRRTRWDRNGWRNDWNGLNVRIESFFPIEFYHFLPTKYMQWSLSSIHLSYLKTSWLHSSHHD